MSAAGKQKLLGAIHGGMGFSGVHAASDTFHTQPDTKDLPSGYWILVTYFLRGPRAK
jgi:type 1 glutamine amidotransferase